MKKSLFVILLFGFVFQALGADIIETKSKKKYNGKIVKTVDDKVVIKTDEGNVIGIPKASLARVRRGKEVFDFVTGERYYLEVRRPFLPFLVLSAASGAYSVVKFQDFRKGRDAAEKYKKEHAGEDYQYLDDKYKKDRAWGYVLAVCSAGTFIMAIQPMEVKVPIGKIKVSLSPAMSPSGIGLAMRF
jgi:hypothetical protein